VHFESGHLRELVLVLLLPHLVQRLIEHGAVRFRFQGLPEQLRSALEVPLRLAFRELLQLLGRERSLL
jgi:hypothetical protein